jgi:hypothetical protein
MTREGRTENSFIKIQGLPYDIAFKNVQLPIRDEYLTFLRKTKFVLCPRGFGVGTARMFETMKAGRVPVIISDRYVVPTGIEWNGCSIVIRERDTWLIPKIVEKYLDIWPSMATNARRAWEQNFAPRSFLNYLASNIPSMLPYTLRASSARKLVYFCKITTARAEHKARPTLGKVRREIGKKLLSWSPRV